MPQFSLAEAEARFCELVQKAMLGEEVVVTKRNKPVVRIVPFYLGKRRPGTGKGMWVSPDFVEPLDSFLFRGSATRLIIRNEKLLSPRKIV